MNCVKKNIALLGVVLLLAPAGYGQSRSTRGPQLTGGTGFVNNVTRNYNPRYVPPIDVTNSNRIEQLLRAGNLYLSLRDAIALALENNVDVEISRYQFNLADVGLLAAQAGNSGTSFDPVIASTLGTNHQTSANAQSSTTGSVITQNTQNTYNFQIQQGFVTGATATLSTNNGKTITTALNSFNPTYRSTAQLQITQPLLNGFGVALNTRGIRVAKNNIRVADFTFQQQINTTLNTVIQAYWNLVSATQSVAVARQALQLSQQLMDQNTKQVEIGTMAPIDLRQTEQQVAQNEQTLVRAEGTVLTQEATLKNLLSRNGLESVSLASVHIIPTSTIDVPNIEPVQPVQDLIDSALKNRPELAQQQLNMDNTRINLTGTRNSMLPTVNVQAGLNNTGIAGTGKATRNLVTGTDTEPNPYFQGALGNAFLQTLRRNFPSWNVQFNIQIPLRNRAAQASYAQQELQLRTTQLQYQRQANQIRLDVTNAQINIQNARAQYAAAEKALAAQEAVVDAEQRKFQLGTSTLYVVTQQLNTLATSRQNKVTAQVAYATAKLSLDVAMSSLMEKYDIVFDDAKDGNVSRRPDPIPDQVNQPQQAAAPAGIGVLQNGPQAAR
jgi:outer membrane protein TolC